MLIFPLCNKNICMEKLEEYGPPRMWVIQLSHNVDLSTSHNNSVMKNKNEIYAAKSGRDTGKIEFSLFTAK